MTLGIDTLWLVCFENTSHMPAADPSTGTEGLLMKRIFMRAECKHRRPIIPDLCSFYF
jgi:hypothetical protein